jgi:hypothetical protein
METVATLRDEFFFSFAVLAFDRRMRGGTDGDVAPLATRQCRSALGEFRART